MVNPSFSSARHGSRTAGCSTFVVMMWLPRRVYARAMPVIARLSLSVAPEVKMISFSFAPRARATVRRDSRSARSASMPFLWTLEALP